MGAINFDREEEEAVQFSRADLRKVIKALDINEKIALLAGADWWTTVPIPRLVRCCQNPSETPETALNSLSMDAGSARCEMFRWPKWS